MLFDFFYVIYNMYVIPLPPGIASITSVGGITLSPLLQHPAGDFYASDTASWFLVPLIAHATGHGHLYPTFPAAQFSAFIRHRAHTGDGRSTHRL
jgi:hypothetical protein